MFRPLVCENLSCGTSSPNMVTGCVRKVIKRSTFPDSVSDKSNQKNKHSQTACLIKSLKWNNFP